MDLHDDRCASHKGQPCNCGAFGREVLKQPTTEATAQYVCPVCSLVDPRGAVIHAATVHDSTKPMELPKQTHPDLVRILAEYFTGPDLVLCSLAMAADPETTAYRRAERYFKARDAFGIPREVDQPGHAEAYLVHALSKFIAPLS